ncbi:unnamed protein product [Protopolystoma xenopodis]|uniref:Uncharacterized protein n=1 Tax=Protopolystoma xenopodis TaxID=117903 RepID=A0A448XLY5_9PLAT|nr:unnamed protein product [Protopolystoma xenopodis]
MTTTTEDLTIATWNPSILFSDKLLPLSSSDSLDLPSLVDISSSAVHTTNASSASVTSQNISSSCLSRPTTYTNLPTNQKGNHQARQQRIQSRLPKRRSPPVGRLGSCFSGWSGGESREGDNLEFHTGTWGWRPPSIEGTETISKKESAAMSSPMNDSDLLNTPPDAIAVGFFNLLIWLILQSLFTGTIVVIA